MAKQKKKNKQDVSEMKTVFLFLCVRAYISDLLHTSYIKYLSERYKVVVFLRDMEGVEDPGKEYYKSENVTYVKFSEPKSKFFILFDMFLRNEFVRIFNDNPAVRWRNERTKDKRRLFLRRIARLFPAGLFTPKFFFYLEQKFFPGYAQFKKFADKRNPSLILTAAPGLHPFDVYAILCAKKAGIPSVSVDISLDNLTVYPRHIRPTDYLIVWNKMNKRQAIKFHGYNNSNVFVSGILRADHYFTPSPKEKDRDTFLENKGLDPNKKTVFYAAKTYGTFYKNFIQTFINWQNTDPFYKDLNLFVRVHPLDSLEDFKEFFGTPNIHIERASSKLKQSDLSKGQKVEMNEDDLINTKDTLKHCDVCVTITSTLTIEAFIFDVPVVIAALPEGRTAGLTFFHNQPYFDNNAVRIAHTYDELKSQIKRYLKDPSLDKTGRTDVLKEMVEPTDGLSYKRSVDFLATILERESNREQRASA